MKDSRITPNRFQNYPAFKHGFEAGGPLLGQAALVLGGYGFTIHEDSFDPAIEVETADEQERILEECARALGVWHPHPLIFYKEECGYSFYGFGGEAQIFAEKDVFVHKACRIAQYGSLVRFFDRIVIQNTICPEAYLFVEGFGRNADSEFVVMMRQRFFRQAFEMSEDEISDYMNLIGFWKSTEELDRIIRYYSNSVIAEDMHPGNIWKTTDGNVVIIDGAFRFNTPDLGKNGLFCPGQRRQIAGRGPR